MPVVGSVDLNMAVDFLSFVSSFPGFKKLPRPPSDFITTKNYFMTVNLFVALLSDLATYIFVIGMACLSCCFLRKREKARNEN